MKDVRLPKTESLKRLYRVFIFCFSATLPTLTPGDVTPDSGATSTHQAQIGVTANGTPMVNIVAPNASGLSHNKYQEYSVGKDHLILNNSINAAETLIGGTVAANPNLNGQTASIILNEVTGSNRSLLQGFTEIAGESAALILANPNGITCNGCGFINTPRSVLSTGTPVIHNGRLMSLAVNQGSIRIEGEGINAGNIDQFDLITRSVVVEGELLARELNVIAGRNDVTYDDLKVIAKTDSVGSQPARAIDSALLGGMYANTIKLIATEQGVGVNLDGDMATNTGAITLSANGKISINRVNAKLALAIQSVSDDVNISDLAYGNSVSVEAKTTITNSGLLASNGNMTLHSDAINNKGELIAGLNADGSLSAAAEMDISTVQLSNELQIVATSRVEIAATEIDNRSGVIEAISGDLILNDVSTLNNAAGMLIAGTDIQLAIDTFTPTAKHGFDAGRNLVINTDDFHNMGEFKVDSDLVLNLSNDFTNSGNLEVSGNINIEAASFTNQATATLISESDGKVITVGDTRNLGVFTTATGMSIEADTVFNQGVLASGDTMRLTAQNEIINSNVGSDGLPITMSGLLDGSSDLGTASGGQNGTLLFSVGKMTLYSDSQTNRYADIYSFADITIAGDAQGTASSGVINSSSRLESAGNISIVTQLFENYRDPIADFDHSLVCGSSTSYLCTHTIVGGDDLGIPSNTPLSEAWLFDVAYDLVTNGYTDEDQYIRAQENLRLLMLASRNSSVFAGNNLTINAGGFSNRGGLLSAGGDMVINANDFLNETVVATVPGPGIGDTQYGSGPGGFAGPYVGNLDSYYYSDGTAVSGFEGTRSVIDEYLRSVPGYFSSEQKPIILNLSALSYEAGGSTELPITVSPSGDIRVFVQNIGSPNAIRQSGSGKLELIRLGEGGAIVGVDSLDPGDDLALLISNHITQHPTNGNFQLTLGDTTYPISFDDDGLLQAQFNSDNLPIEFAIQTALQDQSVTAENNVTYNPFDFAFQSQIVDTIFFQGQLEADGTIEINATNSISNGLAQDGAITVSLPPSITLPSTNITSVDAEAIVVSGIGDSSVQFEALDNAIPPADDFVRVDVDIQIPATGGLFTESNSDQFLVATNPAVSQFIKTFGSDYLLEQLDYQPESNVKRLGDGFYESFLIRAAIMGQTGRRYLHDSLNNDREQMRYLMDNAIAAQTSMDLSIGVRLTAEQVAALTHDMVWLEERIIVGQRVLVPTLYLAEVRRNDIDSAGNIMARNININTARLFNTGGLVTDSNLSIAARKNLFSSGHLVAGENLALKSGGDLIHTGGIKAGKDLAINSEGDMRLQQASVKAGGDAMLLSLGDLNVKSSQISGEGNVVLNASGDISVSSIQSSTSRDNGNIREKPGKTNGTWMKTAKTMGISNNLSVKGSTGNSTIKSGNNLTINAGSDMRLKGVAVSAQGDARLSSQGDIDITTTVRKNRKGSKENYTSTITHTGSSLLAGGDIEIDAERDIEVSGSWIIGDGNVGLNAGGDIVVSSAENSTYKQYQKITYQAASTATEVSGNALGYTQSTNSNSSVGGIGAEREVDEVSNQPIISTERSYETFTVESVVKSGSNLTINAGESLKIQNSSLSGEDLALIAQKDELKFDAKSQIDTKSSLHLQSGKDLEITQDLSVKNDLTLVSGRDILSEGKRLSTGRDLSLMAGRDIDINTTLEKVRSGSEKKYKKTVTHTGSELDAGGDIEISAERDLNVLGSQVTGDGNVALNAGGDMTIANVQDSTYTYSKKTKKKWTGKKKITTKQTYKTTNVESSIKSGNNLTINALVDDKGNVYTREGGKVSLISSDLKGEGQVVVNGANLEVLAQKETKFKLKVTRKKGHFGLSGSTKNEIDKTEIERRSQLNSLTEDLNLLSADNITIASADLEAGEAINIEAAGDIEIHHGSDTTFSESHTVKSGFLSGGSLYSESEDLEGNIKSQANLTQLIAQQLNIRSQGTTKLTGVDIKAGESLQIAASNIDIKDAKSTNSSYDKHNKISIGLGDIGKSLTKLDGLISYDDGKLSITLATVKDDRVDQKSTVTASTDSTLEAGSIGLNAESDEAGEGNITIKGTQVQGSDIELNASNDIALLDAKNTTTIDNAESHGEGKIAFVVKNEYEQTLHAVEALEAAEQALGDARDTYSDYKQNLKDQKQQLATLKQQYANGDGFVEQDDIDDLTDLIDQLEDNDDFYETNILLAAGTVTTRTTALLSQTAAAAESSGTYGFTASVDITVDAIKSELQQYQSISVGSGLYGNNIRINAGNNATIQGSTITANEQVDINSQNLDVIAATNTQRETSQQEQTSGSVSIGMTSSSNGTSVSTSHNQLQSQSHSTTHSNAQMNAANININTKEQTNIHGANIHASDTLNLSTKNLNVASVRDSHNSQSQSEGFSVSGGISGGSNNANNQPTAANSGTQANNSSLGSVGINNSQSNSNTRQTVLTSLTGSTVNIQVEEHTNIKGATIAAVDENGKDNGQLTFSTNTLSASSSTNSTQTDSLAQGITAGSISTLNYQNDQSDGRTKTLATLGSGDITIKDLDNSEIALLNTDVENNEVAIYDIESHQGLQGELDTNLLTEDGRDQIKQDFENFGQNIQIVASGFPEADNGNAIIAAIGSALDTLSFYTGGIIPSHGMNGGLLGNLPVLLGDEDINHQVIQVTTSDSEYMHTHMDLFVPIEDSDYFKSASPKNQKAMEGKGLFVSITPMMLDEVNTSYQNFTNGMLNTEGDAIKNGIDQTGIKTGAVTINYNPTHGFLGDSLESAVDVLPIGMTTGIAQQTGDFVNTVTIIRANWGTNFANHSQGNALFESGVNYQMGLGGFDQNPFYLNENASPDNKNTNLQTPTVSSFGSPVNTLDMEATVEAAGFNYSGAYTAPGDAVGELFGGNNGQNGQGDLWDRINSIADIPELFSDESSHSTYLCNDNDDAKCGSSP